MLQDRFHHYMTHPPGGSSEHAYQHELNCYSQFLSLLPKPYMLLHLKNIAYNDTSDETQALEARPKKRDTLTNLGDCYLHRSHTKRIRPVTGYPTDSPVTGSNKI